MPWREFPEQKADEPRWWERDDAGHEPEPLPSVEELTDEVVGLMLEGEGLAYATGPTPMPTDPDEPPLIDREWLAAMRRYEEQVAAMKRPTPLAGEPFTVEDTLRAYDDALLEDRWARAIGWLLAAWIAVQR